MSTTLTSDQAVKIAGKIKVLQSEIADREEAIENYKNKLAENYGVGVEETIGDTETGFFKVKTFVGKTFNEAYLKKEAPEIWEKAGTTKYVVTSATAKAQLSEEEYALGQKPNSKTTVLVDLLDD